MGLIKILNGSLVEQGSIKDVYSSEIEEMINSDYEFGFTVPLVDSIGSYIVEGNVIEVDGDYFDIAKYKKGQASNGKMAASVECEHVSYRLNESDYNLDYFTKMGSPTEILTELLSGTGFTVGTVEFTETLTHSAQEAMSRRALLKGFVDTLGGELYFNKFEVSILSRRGSATVKDLLVDRNIEVLSKTYDKKETDDDGNPLISYECSLIRPMDIALGDSVSIDYDSLDINVELRVVSISYDPLNPDEVDFEIGNFIPGLEDDVYRIETSTVAKEKTYHGVRIGPENGFEAIRSDNYARGVFNSDTFALQTGDGTGNTWINQVYFDPVSGKYIFNGTLSANVVEALGSVLAPYLYASKANIAELTVDQMNTGDKVAKYLNSNTDDVNYIKIDDQYMEWITASTDGSSTEQVTDRDGNDLYWTDDTHEAVTTETTSYPVTIYVYTEAVKAAINFELDDDGVTYVPKIVMGVGDGVTDKSGKGYIYKNTEGLILEYFSQNDEFKRQIRLTDDGIGFTPEFYSINQGTNESAYSAFTIEQVLDGLSLEFGEDTAISAHASFEITPSAAMTLTVKFRVDGTEVQSRDYYIGSANATTIVATCEIEGIEVGEKTVDVTVTPSTGNVTISAGDYQLHLIVSGIVAEAEAVAGGATKGYNIGGSTSGLSFLTDNDEFEAAINTWTSETNMPSPGRDYFKGSVISGKGYVYGGRDLSYTYGDCDEYDNSGDSWAAKTDIPSPVRYALDASTIDGKGYIYGGRYYGDCDEYDASGDTWANKASMSTRRDPAATTIDLKSYVFGGYYGGYKTTSQEFEPAVNTWTTMTAIPIATSVASAITLSSKAYLCGGTDGSSKYQTCREYDASGDSWASKTDMPTPGRYGTGAAVLDGKGYLFSGIVSTPIADCDEYDLDSDIWTSKNDVSSPSRAYPAVVGL